MVLVCAVLCIVSSALGAVVWENDTLPFRPAAMEKQIEAHFKFRNSGAKEIKITGVKASCGCVVPALAKNAYAPGEAGEVVARFDFGDRVGQHDKTIVVQTDDPNEPVKVLTMQVFIEPLLEMKPAFVFWRVGEPCEAKQISVKLAKGVAAGGLSAASSNPLVEVRLEKSAAGDCVLVVTPRDTSQPQSALIRLETGGSESRKFFAHVRIK